MSASMIYGNESPLFGYQIKTVFENGHFACHWTVISSLRGEETILASGQFDGYDKSAYLVVEYIAPAAAEAV